MDSPPSLRPLPGSRPSERECLCETLARDWIPLQVELKDVSGNDRNEEADLWTDWIPEPEEGDTPAPNPPMICRHDEFPSKAITELDGKPVLTEEIRVQTLEVNHVADVRFDMEPQQGDSIEDLRGKL
jgi:hypothetical protein